MTFQLNLEDIFDRLQWRTTAQPAEKAQVVRRLEHRLKMRAIVIVNHRISQRSRLRFRVKMVINQSRINIILILKLRKMKSIDEMLVLLV